MIRSCPHRFPHGGVKAVSEKPVLSASLGVLPAKARVTDGARTRDLRDHNPMLCQLSYDHQVILQFYQPAPGVQKLGTARGRSKTPLPRLGHDHSKQDPKRLILAWHRYASGRLLKTGTRGPKSGQTVHRILLCVSQDSGRRHGYSGSSTLLLIPRRDLFPTAHLRRGISSSHWLSQRARRSGRCTVDT
jgi:hypothetical protein